MPSKGIILDASGNLIESSFTVPSDLTTLQPLATNLTDIANQAGQTTFGRQLLTKTGAADLRKTIFSRDVQQSGAKPTTRSDGLTLVAGDEWQRTGDYEVPSWFWDGFRWRSPERKFLLSNQITTVSASTGGALVRTGIPLYADRNFYLHRLRGCSYVQLAQSASVFWTTQLFTVSNTNVYTAVSNGSQNTQTFTVGVRWYTWNKAINGLITYNATSAITLMYDITATQPNPTANNTLINALTLEYSLVFP